MNTIKIKRYDVVAAGYQGYVEPEDRSWILYVAADGEPRFYPHRGPDGGVLDDGYARATATPRDAIIALVRRVLDGPAPDPGSVAYWKETVRALITKCMSTLAGEPHAMRIVEALREVFGDDA